MMSVMRLSMQLLEVDFATYTNTKDLLVIIVTSLVFFVFFVIIVVLIILVFIFLVFVYCLIWLHLRLLRLRRWMVCRSTTRHLSRLCGLLSFFLFFICWK